jgi:hypothetical protein
MDWEETGLTQEELDLLQTTHALLRKLARQAMTEALEAFIEWRRPTFAGPLEERCGEDGWFWPNR